MESVSDEIGNALRDWIDFEVTARKIIARRQANRNMLPNEAAAMRAAHELLLDGRISILTKIEATSFGRGHIVTYVAERVK